jgi:hypothetical protein
MDDLVLGMPVERGHLTAPAGPLDHREPSGGRRLRNESGDGCLERHATSLPYRKV